jgi:hypothetical protein
MKPVSIFRKLLEYTITSLAQIFALSELPESQGKMVSRCVLLRPGFRHAHCCIQLCGCASLNPLMYVPNAGK